MTSALHPARVNIMTAVNNGTKTLNMRFVPGGSRECLHACVRTTARYHAEPRASCCAPVDQRTTRLCMTSSRTTATVVAIVPIEMRGFRCGLMGRRWGRTGGAPLRGVPRCPSQAGSQPRCAAFFDLEPSEDHRAQAVGAGRGPSRERIQRQERVQSCDRRLIQPDGDVVLWGIAATHALPWRGLSSPSTMWMRTAGAKPSVGDDAAILIPSPGRYRHAVPDGLPLSHHSKCQHRRAYSRITRATAPSTVSSPITTGAPLSQSRPPLTEAT